MENQQTDGLPVWVVLCTVPGPEAGRDLARRLIERRLAACVNVQAEVDSIYRWQGKTQCDTEALMIIKTTAHRYPALELWLQEHHPYDNPEIVAVGSTAVAKAYSDWVHTSVED